MGQRTSVYLDDDLRAAVKASGVPLAEPMRRGLAASSASKVPVPGPAEAGTVSILPAPAVGRMLTGRC